MSHGKYTHRISDKDGYWWLAGEDGVKMYLGELVGPSGDVIDTEKERDYAGPVEKFYSALGDECLIVKLTKFKGNK